MKIYSTWHIRALVMAVSLLYIYPIYYAITYTYYLDFEWIIERWLLGVIILGGFAGGFIVTLIAKYRLWQRDIKIEYRKEFSYLLLVSAFGLLGLVVLYVELGGNPQYIIHLLIGLFIFNYIVVTYLGRKLFNVSLIGKDINE